jgi:transposase
VTIVGSSSGTVPWPIGEINGVRELIVFKGLARAVRQESPAAVAAAWGISRATAERWKANCGHPRRRKKQTRATPATDWDRQQDDLVSRVSLSDAARITGRTVTAIRKRRRILGLPDGRLKSQRSKRSEGLEQQAIEARLRMRQYCEQLAVSMAKLKTTFQVSRATVSYWQQRAAETAQADTRGRDTAAPNLSQMPLVVSHLHDR